MLENSNSSKSDLRQRHGVLCRACGYSLYQAPGEQCPECGAAFDPFVRATVDMSSPPTVSGRWAFLIAGAVIVLFILIQILISML